MNRPKQEPLETWQHEEIVNSISKEKEERLAAGCVWGVVGESTNEEEILYWCKAYNVPYCIAIKHRDFWLRCVCHSKKVK